MNKEAPVYVFGVNNPPQMDKTSATVKDELGTSE